MAAFFPGGIMYRYLVCKTIANYPAKPMFVLASQHDTAHPFRMFATLAELAFSLREAVLGYGDVNALVAIKNEVAADIVWKLDGTLPDRVHECARLDHNEMRELARLLA